MTDKKGKIIRVSNVQGLLRDRL